LIRNWRQIFPIITMMRFTDRTADTEWKVLTVWFLLLDRGHVVHGVQGGDPSAFFNFLGVSFGYLPSCEDQIREMDLNLRNIDAEPISFYWSTRLFLFLIAAAALKERGLGKGIQTVENNCFVWTHTIWEELSNLTSNYSTFRAVCILLTKQFITNEGFSFYSTCCALRWLSWGQGWHVQWWEPALTAFHRLNGTCSISGPHVSVEFLGGSLFSFGWFPPCASRLLMKSPIFDSKYFSLFSVCWFNGPR